MRFVVVALAALLPSLAYAQSVPFDGSRSQIPNITLPSNIFWNPSQWRQAWESKADTNNPVFTGTGSFVNLTVSGSLTLGSLNNTPIGNTTPSTGAFTTLTATGAASLTGTGTALAVTNGASFGSISSPGALGITAGGSSLINLRDANGTLFQAADNGTSVVNYLKALPNTTGNPAILTVDGSDANISLMLSAKGTGIIETFPGKTLRGTYLSARPDLSGGTTWSGGGAAEGVSSIYVTGSVTGSATLATAAANYFAVGSDNVAANPTYGFAAMDLDYNFGGAAMTGGRVGYRLNMLLNAATGNTGGQYVGGQFNISANHSDAQGSLFGLNPSVALSSGATGYNLITDIEADIAAEAGSSVKTIGGIGVILTSNDAVVGSDGYDSAYVIGSQPGETGGFQYGLRIGGTGGPWPMLSTGTLIFAYEGSTTMSLANGVDLSFPNFSGASFRSAGFSVDGSGNIQSGTCYINNSSTGGAIDCSGSIATAVALVSGGSGWPTDGNQYWATDSNGGIYNLTVNGSGVVTAVTMYRAPVAKSTPPGNPVTLTPGPIANGRGATGLTVNLTWQSRTRLQLQPSGGVIIVSGMPTNCTSEPSGTLWNNSGVVNVCP